MNVFDTVPKNLPLSDPLQFSFLMALEALKLNVNFNGGFDFAKYPTDRQNKKALPAFEYAVNNWREIRPAQNSLDGIRLEQDILCALWRNQPDQADCKIKWEKNPDGSDLLREYDMDYLYEFEQWKLSTWQDLRRIISTLLVRGYNKRQPGTGEKYTTPGDIWNFELVNNQITYIYAKDATANKFLGVGATFTLRSDTFDCCPSIDRTLYTLQKFKDLGFLFDEHV